MKEGGEEMEIWSDRWLEHQARKLELKVGYVQIGQGRIYKFFKKIQWWCRGGSYE